MTSPQLGYIILYVKNVLRTVEFYEQAFRLERRMVHESDTYAEMETGSTALAFADECATPTANLFTPNDPSAKASAFEVALVTNDVLELFEHACLTGAKEVSPPEEKPWGQTVAYVRDLNGVLVEICTPIA